eukprot:CAMPEP_0175155630 /NCGR_PEP_ID=MMETSP0087-20121206/21098_1 /TAXON_ID=136419 /ORGANISM="Unknown Unknown, Strain D1" /LENGTH=51 /DNA_ID=CAMNT_0016442839 /DNA_START=344 /DNA_END=499 /DNA_ORIENTATION=-
MLHNELQSPTKNFADEMNIKCMSSSVAATTATATAAASAAHAATGHALVKL